MVLKGLLYFASIICTAWTHEYPHEICSYHTDGIFAKPDNCAQYYDCKLSLSTYLQPGYLGDFIGECPYPKLFSTETGMCEDFLDVDCGYRKEIVYACDYQRNQCARGHCRPCEYTYPDCRDLPDGDHVWPGMEHTTRYLSCLKGRGFVKMCESYYGREYFSAVTGQCELVRPFRGYYFTFTRH